MDELIKIDIVTNINKTRIIHISWNVKKIKKIFIWKSLLVSVFTQGVPIKTFQLPVDPDSYRSIFLGDAMYNLKFKSGVLAHYAWQNKLKWNRIML